MEHFELIEARPGDVEPQAMLDSHPKSPEERIEIQTALEELRKSRFDTLTIFQTVKVFRVAILYCIMAYTMGMIDGWEVCRGAL